ASVSHVAVQLARQFFPSLREASILLVGSGQMGELAARNLCDNGAQRLVLINRTQPHALHLAQRLGVIHRSYAELPEALAEAGVQAIIAEEVSAFRRWLHARSVADTISDLRQHADALRQQELARTMRQLAPSLSERETAALQEFTRRLVNKLLHAPTLRLKDA